MTVNLFRFAHNYNCIHSSIKYTLKYIPLTISHRCYGSALYLSSREANKNFAYLIPYLDLDTKFQDIEKFQHEITLRGMNINAKEMKKSWTFFKEIYVKELTLKEKRMEISNEMKHLVKKKEKTVEEQQKMVKLSSHAKLAKESLKVVKDVLSDLEETVIVEMLKLPNDLDPDTPPESPLLLKQFGTIKELPENSVKSHVEIGRNLGLVNYMNPLLYYLCDEAALFELAVANYLGNVLGKNNMIRIAGSDFSRSIVVEGSGLNHEDPMNVFILENNEDIERGSPNRMHLIGGASLQSFLALHTKQLINPNSLPLKYFATGRQYVPLPENVKQNGLFTACQAVVGHVFVVLKDSKNEKHKIMLNKLVDIVCQIYDEICEHYRVVLRPAPELRPWESSRVSFELYSHYLRNYVEVGHISTYGNYISQRLLIAYQTSTGRDYPAIISGSVLSVPKLLGCLLEQNPEKFQIPSKSNKIVFDTRKEGLLFSMGLEFGNLPVRIRRVLYVGLSPYEQRAWIKVVSHGLPNLVMRAWRVTPVIAPNFIFTLLLMKWANAKNRELNRKNPALYKDDE